MWSLPTTLPNLSGAKAIAIDTETHDPDLKRLGPGVRRDGYMVGISVGTPDGFKTYLPFDHAEGNQFDKEVIMRWARAELCRPGQPKIGANLLYDLDYLYQEGVKVSGPFYDIQVAEPLINENQRRYSLDALAVKYLGENKNETLLEEACRARGWKGKPQNHLWKLPPKFVGPYAESDADQPIRIFKEQCKILKQENLWDLFKMETALVPLLLAMRRRGVRIDRTKVERVLDESEKQLKALTRELDKYGINCWAAETIGKAFDREGIEYPLTAKTKAPSIIKPWLESHGHPLCKKIVEARKMDKFKSTFLLGSILDQIVGDRVHCSFNQLKSDDKGTVSGRFSSSQPNLQFIPSRDAVLGPLTRGFFIPEPGETWYRADYSQVELRILAHYAMGPGSDEVRETYNKNPDIDFHQMCADMAGTDRGSAKAINFGIVYGMGAFKLGQSLGLNVDEAKAFLEKYHVKLPFAKYTAQVATDTATQRGYVKTIMMRRRRFDLWEPRDWDLSREVKATRDKAEMLELVKERIQKARAEGYRPPKPGVKRAGTFKALNSIIQGSAADIMKKAMVKVWESGICDVNGVPLLTVHDELDGSMPDTKAGHEALKEMIRIMEGCMKLRVPLLVDYDTGKNWGVCK